MPVPVSSVTGSLARPRNRRHSSHTARGCVTPALTQNGVHRPGIVLAAVAFHQFNAVERGQIRARPRSERRVDFDTHDAAGRTHDGGDDGRVVAQPTAHVKDVIPGLELKEMKPQSEPARLPVVQPHEVHRSPQRSRDGTGAPNSSWSSPVQGDGARRRFAICCQRLVGAVPRMSHGDGSRKSSRSTRANAATSSSDRRKRWRLQRTSRIRSAYQQRSTYNLPLPTLALMMIEKSLRPETRRPNVSVSVAVAHLASAAVGCKPGLASIFEKSLNFCSRMAEPRRKLPAKYFRTSPRSRLSSISQQSQPTKLAASGHSSSREDRLNRLRSLCARTSMLRPVPVNRLVRPLVHPVVLFPVISNRGVLD